MCSSVPGVSSIVSCADYSNTCLIGIDRLGYTHRSCSNSTFDETTAENQANYPNGLHICIESKCNDKVFPTDRLQCYQCSGGNDCDVIESNATIQSQPCSIYSKLDQCYTYISEGGKFLKTTNFHLFIFFNNFLQPLNSICRSKNVPWLFERCKFTINV